ncbi:unnamed protein product [Thelazia callipaeda]|uniref:DUF1394 domain-containing protein n=1 Tax=Thelazia callipaeda TaxID=103827 RepID=A0A0N5D5X5_THECL|nr:unnamed protein product [Thelazia callipaeda]
MKSGSSCAEVVRSMLLASCDGSKTNLPDVNVFLDFEHAVPSESELQLCDLAEKILEQANVLLEDVKHYSAGASAEIRIAIQQPNNKGVQRQALDILDKLVMRIRAYYELSQRIEQIIPLLLWDLCSVTAIRFVYDLMVPANTYPYDPIGNNQVFSGPLPPAEQLDSLQATCRQFARLINFVLSFDAVKMCTPALQNDFSFYRRAMSRECDEQFAIPLELANTISLFLACPTPMLSAFITATTNFVATNGDLPIANTTDTLATVVQIFKVCRFMVEKEENWERLSDQNCSFTMRVMVGAIILYDHIDNAGAFCKESPIDIRSIVELIKTQSRNQEAESLLSALRYTTKHLNDGTTPKSVRALFP